MRKRRPMKRKKSRREFRKNSDKTHKINLRQTPMRGGFRL